MKCWNCGVEIIKAENWTSLNKLWIENPENNPQPHDFKKCYREKLKREGKWKERTEEEEQEVPKTEVDYARQKSRTFTAGPVSCYYCDFTTIYVGEYEFHVVTEHYKAQTVIEKYETGSVKQDIHVLCYPNKADFENENFKLAFPEAKPKGYSWEK